MCIYIVLYMFYIRNIRVFSSILSYGFYMFHMFITYNQHFIYIFIYMYLCIGSLYCVYIYIHIYVRFTCTLYVSYIFIHWHRMYMIH